MPMAFLCGKGLDVPGVTRLCLGVSTILLTAAELSAARLRRARRHSLISGSLDDPTDRRRGLRRETGAYPGSLTPTSEVLGSSSDSQHLCGWLSLTPMTCLHVSSAITSSNIRGSRWLVRFPASTLIACPLHLWPALRCEGLDVPDVTRLYLGVSAARRIPSIYADDLSLTPIACPRTSLQ